MYFASSHRSFSNWIVISISSLIQPALASVTLSDCASAVQEQIAHNASLANDTYYFVVTPANNNSLVLTLNGCYDWCSSETNSINPQCGLRLFQWVLPAVILIGSIQNPPVVWWKRLWAMLRPVSDPLDCLLSMNYVLEVYALCYKHAKDLLSDDPEDKRQRVVKSLAVILHGIHDLTPSIEIHDLSNELKVSLGVLASRLPAVETLLNSTAAEIMDNKSREMWKAYGATFFAVANIVFAMIPPAAPGSQPVSGATIAATLALSPLLLMVLLSNAIGEYKSLHTLHKTVKHFLKELESLMADAVTQTDAAPMGNAQP